MDKRKARNFGGLVGCLAVTALLGCGLYYGDLPVKSFVDGSSSSGAQPTSVANSDGTMVIVLPKGPLFAASVGATLSLNATLTPADVTDKRIAWASSDSAKVSFDSSSTVSGGIATAKLVAVFTGSVTVTATAFADPAVKAAVLLYCPNALAADGPTNPALWLNSASFTALSTKEVSGSGAAYASGAASPVTQITGGYLVSLTDFAIGSTSKVGVSLTWDGSDTARIPTVFESLNLAEGASYGDVSDKSFFTYKKSVTGVLSDVSKDIVSVSGFSASGNVTLRFMVSGVVTGADYTVIGVADTEIRVYNTVAYVAPTGISAGGPSGTTFE